MSTGPLYCQKCGRPNGATAPKCIWCGSGIDKGSGVKEKFDTTNIEIEYLSGIDGIDGPANVKLKIAESGIEATVPPASKKAKIDARSIMGAVVVDASFIVEGKRALAPLRWW